MGSKAHSPIEEQYCLVPVYSDIALTEDIESHVALEESSSSKGKRKGCVNTKSKKGKEKAKPTCNAKNTSKERMKKNKTVRGQNTSRKKYETKRVLLPDLNLINWRKDDGISRYKKKPDLRPVLAGPPKSTKPLGMDTKESEHTRASPPILTERSKSSLEWFGPRQVLTAEMNTLTQTGGVKQECENASRESSSFVDTKKVSLESSPVCMESKGDTNCFKEETVTLIDYDSECDIDVKDEPLISDEEVTENKNLTLPDNTSIFDQVPPILDSLEILEKNSEQPYNLSKPNVSPSTSFAKYLSQLVLPTTPIVADQQSLILPFPVSSTTSLASQTGRSYLSLPKRQNSPPIRTLKCDVNISNDMFTTNTSVKVQPTSPFHVLGSPVSFPGKDAYSKERRVSVRIEKIDQLHLDKNNKYAPSTSQPALEEKMLGCQVVNPRTSTSVRSLQFCSVCLKVVSIIAHVCPEGVSGRKLFRCVMCRMKYSSFMTLQFHIWNVHKRTNTGLAIESMWNLKKSNAHQISEPERPFVRVPFHSCDACSPRNTCQSCRYRSERYIAQLTQLSTCVLCKQNFGKPKALESHMRRHENILIYCRSCCRDLQFEAFMHEQHLWRCMGKYCSICDYEASCGDDYRHHCSKHNAPNMYWKCKHCSNLFCSRHNLELHFLKIYTYSFMLGKKLARRFGRSKTLIVERELNV